MTASARLRSESGLRASRPAPPLARWSAGLILSQFWWGAVFLINVPIMLLLLALGPSCCPSSS